MFLSREDYYKICLLRLSVRIKMYICEEAAQSIANFVDGLGSHVVRSILRR